jgi:hypothetical protein
MDYTNYTSAKVFFAGTQVTEENLGIKVVMKTNVWSQQQI